MDKRKHLENKISDCLNHYDRYELFDPVMKSVDDLLIDKPTYFSRGNIDNWAASIVYAISRNKHKHFKDSLRALTLSDICSFFNANKTTISKKAGKIIDLLDLGFYQIENRDFDAIDDPQDIFEEDLYYNEIIGIRAIFETTRKFDRAKRLQLTELVKIILKNLNEDDLHENQILLRNLECKSKKFTIELEGYQDSIEMVLDELESEGFNYIESSYILEDENMYAPSSHYAMFMEHFEIMNFGSRDYENMEEFQNEVNKLAGKSLDEIKKGRSIAKESEALIHALKAFNLPRASSIQEVTSIITDYPNCIEAYICLAGWNDDHEERIDLLEDALDKGERALNIHEINNNNLWWADHKTRPYMRAMLFLGIELLLNDYEEEGLEVLKEMLEMNKADNLNVRPILLKHYVNKKKWHHLKTLLKNYPDDTSIDFMYGKVLYLYYAKGSKYKAKQALFSAFERNKYPILIISGLEPMPESEQVSQFLIGDPIEAIHVVYMLSDCFERDSNLLDWMIASMINSGKLDIYLSENKDKTIGQHSDPKTAKIIPLNFKV